MTRLPQKARPFAVSLRAFFFLLWYHALPFFIARTAAFALKKKEHTNTKLQAALQKKKETECREYISYYDTRLTLKRERKKKKNRALLLF